MKQLAVIIFAISLFINNKTLQAQDSKKEEIKIQTSAVCSMCKETLEGNLALEKGIRKAELDLSNSVITITYNPSKTNPDKIRKAIALIGYDADTVKADEKAYEKLSKCCKKGNSKH